MKTLHLTLKKKWFDMIASGEKKEEYREIKPYWVRRLLWIYSPMDEQDLAELTTDLQKLWQPEARFDTYSELINHFNCAFARYGRVMFKNGYAKDAPTMEVEFKGIDIGPAVPEWSDNWQGDVFRIKLGKVLSITRPAIVDGGIVEAHA